MELKDLRAHWDALAAVDPLWAILSDPARRDGGWDVAEFLATGEAAVTHLMAYARSLRLRVGWNRALDFGCGAGRLTQALCRFFDECHGVDISRSMVAIANQLNGHPDKCVYHVNVEDDLSVFSDNHFDFVCTMLVLQHMPPTYIERYIKEFVRVVAPGGLVVFQAPSDVIPVGSPVVDAHSAAQCALPNLAFWARVSLVDIPSSWRPGRQELLRVRVKNESAFAWPSLGDTHGTYQVKLGNRWFDERGNVVTRHDGRTLLPSDLRTLDEVELPLLVTVPTAPGRYLLEADMVQEGVSWFKDRGTRTAKVGVSIHGSERELREHRRDPAILMYGIPLLHVLDLVNEWGGRVVDVREDRLAGRDWLSYTYVVTK